MKSYCRWAALIGGCILLTGCAAASQATRDVLNTLVEEGAMTPAVRDQVLASMGTGWDVVLDHAIDIVSGTVLAYTGIRLQRGPATRAENVQKKKQAKAHPA